MDYKIKAPNKAYNGQSAGVQFINGEGIAKDGKSVDWFKNKGYEVEPIEEQTKTSKENEQNGDPEKIENQETNIKNMSKDALITFAEDKKIDISECKNNDERKAKIIKSLEESGVNDNPEIKIDESDSAEGSDGK